MGKKSKRLRRQQKIMQGKKYVLLYGSLREGQYNFERFNKAYPNGLKKIRTVTLSGYKMYDMGSYPCCIYTGFAHHEVVFELMEASNECYDAIVAMENGAGYDTHTVDTWVRPSANVTMSIKASVFLFSAVQEKQLDQWYKVVESGNWVYYQIPEATGSWPTEEEKEEEAKVVNIYPEDN